MYRVLCDGLPIYDLRDENLVLIDPKLDLEVNKAGAFSFKMPPQHPQYELPQKMLSCIQVFQDEEEVFNGRIVECKIDFYNRKHFTCEGQLAYLNDSIQRPAEYHDMTVRGYLESLITSHNEQVKKDRQFKVGIVTVTDNNDSLYRYTNYNSTMKEIKEDLVDDLGGYLRVRNVNGTAYLDYISDYDNVSTQSIEFGENLLDFSRNTDVSDIATVFIPLGAKLEESPIAALEQRLTIESVNNGSDSLVNLDAVKKFGYITKTITWDEVTTPKMLLYKANKYIADYQWDSMTLEVNAVDMHWTDADVEQFKLGDKIKAHSSLHGLDRYFPLSKMSIQLNNLSSSKFTLGTVVNTKLTAKSQTISNTASKAVETIPVPSAIVKQAVDQATALITAATHGHVVTTANEQLIMDTNDVNTARKVWRWNLNGLGYSSTGYNGTYKTAITMDGQIVGERLVGGSVSAEKLDITYRNQVIKEIADAEMVQIGSGAERAVKDYMLTRYACYLIAQNGDPRKEEIAFAQSYFAVQTRKQELIEERIAYIERTEARGKLRESEKRLSQNIYERGVDDAGFGRIRSRGDQALFGGKSTQEMKKKLGVSDKRPLADFLPTLTIAAKNLATEMTNYNVEEKDLQGESAITSEHVQNNQSVRDTLGSRGIKPEELPPSEDIKKLERRVKSQEKKLVQESGKLPQTK